jgi:hypothetical protein
MNRDNALMESPMIGSDLRPSHEIRRVRTMCPRTAINDLTSGVRSLPAAAAQAFPGGQAAYEARVEVSPEDS